MAKPDRIELIARGVLRQRGHILACRNLKHDYLYLPGGHVEFGETAAQAVTREIQEETGLDIRVGACALVSEGIFETRGTLHHEVNLVFHVELEVASDQESGLVPVASRESDLGFEWVDLASVADMDLRPAPIRAWLASGGVADPASPTCIWIGGTP